MTVANRHLRLNSGKEEDTRTTTMYNVAYTGPNTKPVPVFTSSDTSVATVDQNGNIEAVGTGKILLRTSLFMVSFQSSFVMSRILSAWIA